MSSTVVASPADPLTLFHPALRQWFSEAFPAPTDAQAKAWPVIASGHNTLLLAPTGSGKTLATFLVAINRFMFLPHEHRSQQRGVRVLYISPLKALGVDVERNLRAPIAGVRAVAQRMGVDYHVPSIAVRSGDTPTADRRDLARRPPDILITTPESLYLILTSRARDMLRTVDTVIIDEIHSLVGNKRGTHLFLSLERLENLRRAENPLPPGEGGSPKANRVREPRQSPSMPLHPQPAFGHLLPEGEGLNSTPRPLQRIGLSATQRPLHEIASLLGGAEATANPDEPPTPRPVEIIEAGRGKQLDLRIEVPVEDMANLGQAEFQSGPASAGPTIASIWPSIHPRLVELIRAHRSTMIFVNSRRLAERLAAAINELAGEELALAHHGSIAKDTRLLIEDRLKLGQLPAIVATSSLELGIDMGAVDLVIQIEAPPSIASGIQRIGRAGHQVGAASSGVIFPKYRGDLLACAAAAERMLRGEVEETYYPRNPLDVLAQQLVAMVALEPVAIDELYATVRRAAPFAQLPRSSFESVLDLLAGRYPSYEFAELTPRVNWDRIAGIVSPRKGTQRLAILNAGTIPDRGMYGVFLADGASDGDRGGRGSRVGELDEEMVFETHPGDVFLLGASSWRVLDITNDRVIVAPAPGEPGRMPFWRGDGPGRPLEFGRAIGRLTHRLARAEADETLDRITSAGVLDERAANNLRNYVHDQALATEEPPSDRTIVVECFVDEVGDWRVCILSSLGARVHAPWAMAVAARLRSETTGEVDLMWSDDGIVFRLPEADEPPPLELLFPAADEIEEEVVRQLGSTALFAARFRENAARALLLPRRQAGKRTPLWLQRRRSADLLSVASRYPQFPILLETYRECLRDVFDLRGLRSVLHDIERRTIRVKQVITHTASPFASSLMFNYVGNFIYDGDAPLAERRAAMLALDHAQLRELLGDAELRELLDPESIEQYALELQRLDGKRPVRDADELHDLLMQLGDLTVDEMVARAGSRVAGVESAADETPDHHAGGAPPARPQPPAPSTGDVEAWLKQLARQRRTIEVRIAGQRRVIAAEDAALYRDALGVVIPPGLPEAFLDQVDEPLAQLLGRYARTHVPFRLEQVAARFALGANPVRVALDRLIVRRRVVEGEFLPGERSREFCDVDVLRVLKRRSLAKLRKQIEPVDQAALARFLPQWQGVTQPRRGLDGLLDVIEQLQGIPLPASDWERCILPARITNYKTGDLDQLCAAGEIVWRGFDALGPSDGRIGLYLASAVAKLAPPPAEPDDDLQRKLVELLGLRGALFFDDLVATVGGFRNDVLEALWRLVWRGSVTNDTLAPLRSLRRQAREERSKAPRRSRSFRSRRTARLPGSEGRWSLVPAIDRDVTVTERQTTWAAQLLERYGILTREMFAYEGIAGGFSGVYPVLKAMEEAGRIRRGYFVAGLGAAQFAAAGAEDRLREPSNADRASRGMVLASSDPANPYGVALAWPERRAPDAPRPSRTAGARVILLDGTLIGYLSRSGQHLLTFLPEIEPQRSTAEQALVDTLTHLATSERPVFLTQIDGAAASDSPWARPLASAGFVSTSRGMLLRRRVADA